MTQNEILNLLLIVLLVSNEKSDCDPAATASTLNEIILISLLLSNCNNSCNCNDNNNNNNTTF